jgi:protein-tyrosine phosphatase
LIDLHSHILPAVDDGAPDLEAALAMARMAAEDGIVAMACTPHFLPGLYDNNASDIRSRIARLSDEIMQAGIKLELVVGADAHVRPDFLSCLREGRLLTLNDSRYVLVEPPHDIMPKRLDELFHNLQMAGYVPILTHPERLRWIEQNYSVIADLARSGVWMQITAGALTGRFGRRPHYWSRRMLAEGLVSFIASDAHNIRSRPPILSEAFSVAETEVGYGEAVNLVVTRPASILDDAPVEDVPPLPAGKPAVSAPAEPLWRRLFMGGA